MNSLLCKTSDSLSIRGICQRLPKQFIVIANTSKYFHSQTTDNLADKQNFTKVSLILATLEIYLGENTLQQIAANSISSFTGLPKTANNYIFSFLLWDIFS